MCLIWLEVLLKCLFHHSTRWVAIITTFWRSGPENEAFLNDREYTNVKGRERDPKISLSWSRGESRVRNPIWTCCLTNTVPCLCHITWPTDLSHRLVCLRGSLGSGGPVGQSLSKLQKTFAKQFILCFFWWESTWPPQVKPLIIHSDTSNQSFQSGEMSGQSARTLHRVLIIHVFTCAV